jgi:dGTPase
MEATGASALEVLLTRFWSAISNREKFDDLRSRRKAAVDTYVFSLVSPNYLEDAVLSCDTKGIAGTIRYRELRLLTDMIAGMTDSYAIRLAEQLRSLA